MGENKKYGIVCDNYKVSKFKNELDKAGYEYEVQPNGILTVIKVSAPESQFKEVTKLVTKVNLHFQRGN